MTMIAASLCEGCARMREVISGRGSRFLLCEHSRADPRFPKYSPQPVIRCEGHVGRGDAPSGSSSGPDDLGPGRPLS